MSTSRRLGWTIAVHGSRGIKDLDLIAVPWTDAAAPHEELIMALLAGVPRLLIHAKADLSWGVEKKPHGRIAVLFSRFPFPGRLIDLSIMPRAAT